MFKKIKSKKNIAKKKSKTLKKGGSKKNNIHKGGKKHYSIKFIPASSLL
jgi:hypothetical protein